MGSCPPPCDRSQNGVCAEHGSLTRCWNIRSLRELHNLLDDCDRVRLVPGEGELTLEALRALVDGLGGFRLQITDEGLVEISRQRW